MFTASEKIEFIQDLQAAAEDRDGRQIHRLAEHGLDMGFISKKEFTSLTGTAKALDQLLRREAGDMIAATVVFIKSL